MYACEDVLVPVQRSPSSQAEGGFCQGRRVAWGQRLGLISLSVSPSQEGPQWLHVRDFDRLLRESQREVLRLQRQIALRNQQEPPLRPRPRGPAAPARAGKPAPGAPVEVSASARAGVWRWGEGPLISVPAPRSESRGPCGGVYAPRVPALS